MAQPGTYEVVGHCKAEGCGIPMVSKWAWTIGVRPAGHVSAGGLGLCRKHHYRFLRNGTTEKLPPVARKPRGGTHRSRQEVLEDYLMIKDSVSSIREAAERMGMTFAALDTALYRARLDGVTEAMPPIDQVVRADSRGIVYTSTAA